MCCLMKEPLTLQQWIRMAFSLGLQREMCIGKCICETEVNVNESIPCFN